MSLINYFNECLARHEELLFMELSQASMWKPEYVGVDYIRSKNINGKNAIEIITNVIKVIKADGIVKNASFLIGPDNVLIKLTATGCIHLPKEAHLKEAGVNPYCCPIMNMIFDSLLNKLNYEITFLGGNLDVNLEKGQCVVKGGAWKNADSVGVPVSDWTKL